MTKTIKAKFNKLDEQTNIDKNRATAFKFHENTNFCWKLFIVPIK